MKEKMAKSVISKIKSLLIPIILVVIWILIGDRVKPIILPSLSSVMKALLGLIQNGELFRAWYTSLFRIVAATLLSVSVSLPLGLLSVNFRLMGDIITPFTNFIRFIPVTIFYPLLITWTGIDETMKITFLFLATFFYFFPTTLITLRNIDKSYIEIALTGGANKWKLIKNVYIPAALPSLAQSFLMMFGIGFTYMIIAETVNARWGMGHLMLIAGARGRTDMVFAVVIVVILTGVLIDMAGNLIIRKSFKWHFAKGAKH